MIQPKNPPAIVNKATRITTSTSFDAILDEYYSLFYGPAREIMKAFHEYVEANYGYAAGNSQILNTMRNFLIEARAVTGNTIYGKRIDLLIGLMDH